MTSVSLVLSASVLDPDAADEIEPREADDGLGGAPEASSSGVDGSKRVLDVDADVSVSRDASTARRAEGSLRDGVCDGGMGGVGGFQCGDLLADVPISLGDSERVLDPEVEDAPV